MGLVRQLDGLATRIELEGMDGSQYNSKRLPEEKEILKALEGKDTLHTLFLYSSDPITKWIFPCQSLSSAYTMLILSSDIILFDFELE